MKELNKDSQLPNHCLKPLFIYKNVVCSTQELVDKYADLGAARIGDTVGMRIEETVQEFSDR